MNEWPASNDAELLARFRAGDDSALDALYTQYEGPLFRFLFGILKNHHQAEDALQETFVQAVRHADRVDGQTFRGWLYTVAHRQAMLCKRKARRVPASADPVGLLDLVEADSDREPALDRADDLRLVGELLQLLPVSQQDVIRLRVVDGLRFREVAEQLGCPLNTALARMHDGVKALRTLWEARHG